MPATLDPRANRRAARWIVRVGLWGGAVCLLVGVAVHHRVGPAAARATQSENPGRAGVGAVQAVPQRDRPRPPVEEGTGGSGTAALAPAARTQPDEERFGAPVEGWLPSEEETRGAGPAALLGAALKQLAPAAFAVLGTMLVTIGAVFALLGRMGVLAAVAALRHGMEAPEPRHDLPSPERRSGDSAPVYGEDAGAASISVEPYGIRAAGRGSGEAGRNMSTDSVGPITHHATAPARADAAKPDLGVQSPKPQAAGGAAEPSLPVDEPPPLEPPQPGDLIDAWDEYRCNGDGHFSPRGLQEVIDRWELAARVVHGDRVDASGAVLVVETPGTPNFWVLPSFNKSPRAVADWFDDASSGALTGRTQHVARVARGRWPESGTGRCEVVERGEVR